MPPTRDSKSSDPNRNDRMKTGKKTGTGALTMRSPRSGAEVPTGAHPGNTGGKRGRSGRVPSIVRELALESFADRVHLLAEIADGIAFRRVKVGAHETETFTSTEVSDRLRALEMLAKYGLGTIKGASVDDVRDRVRATLDVIQDRTPPELFASIVGELRPIWA
jgi:hypothetical protein